MSNFNFGQWEFIPPFREIMYEGMAGLIVVLRGTIGESLVRGIRRYTPFETGRARRSCKVIGIRTVSQGIKLYVGWVRRDFPRGKFYPVFLGEGTGIYGKNAQTIVGKKKVGRKIRKSPSIRFEIHGRWITVKQIRGIRPRRMLEKGYEDAREAIIVTLGQTFVRAFKAGKTRRTRGAI